MFDTIKALWAGFSGGLKEFGEARKMVWSLLFTFLAGWLATAFAGWISYPSYRSFIAYLPGADLIALFFTAGVACFLYFALAYLSGFSVERWRGTDPNVRNYSILGARIFGVAAILFLTVDLYMNFQGTTHRANDVAGSVATFSYTTPSSRQADLDRDRERLDQLLNGQLGGYGWPDQKGVFHLNNSGKKYQRELSANIRRLQTADSTDRAAALANVEALNTDRAEVKALAKDAMKNAVYGVYVLVLILCIVQAYITEVIQEAQGISWVRSAPRTAPSVATATRKTAMSAKVSIPLEPSKTATRHTATRHCAHCGEEFTGRKDKKYCSDDCRMDAYEIRTGKKLRRGRTYR